VTRVRIPPTLRAETGGAREIDAEGETVRDLLEDLTARFPALRDRLWEDGDVAPFVNVYVGGEDVRTREGIETPVAAGETVILLPAMAGGSPGPLAGASSRPAERTATSAKPTWPLVGIASDALAASGGASRRWRQDPARSPLGRAECTVLRGSRLAPLPARRQRPGDAAATDRTACFRPGQPAPPG
jgi:molybdopterin synthase sulfur carrier subunit